jgi:hypothetical protein
VTEGQSNAARERPVAQSVRANQTPLVPAQAGFQSRLSAFAVTDRNQEIGDCGAKRCNAFCRNNIACSGLRAMARHDLQQAHDGDNDIVNNSRPKAVTGNFDPK